MKRIILSSIATVGLLSGFIGAVCFAYYCPQIMLIIPGSIAAACLVGLVYSMFYTIFEDGMGDE